MTIWTLLDILSEFQRATSTGGGRVTDDGRARVTQADPTTDPLSDEDWTLVEIIAEFQRQTADGRGRVTADGRPRITQPDPAPDAPATTNIWTPTAPSASPF
jgi:hypothetical protein